MRCHLCIERITRDQERCPGGHPTKPEPSQILLHLQQLVVVWSKEKNLSISMINPIERFNPRSSLLHDTQKHLIYMSSKELFGKEYILYFLFCSCRVDCVALGILESSNLVHKIKIWQSNTGTIFWTFSLCMEARHMRCRINCSCWHYIQTINWSFLSVKTILFYSLESNI